MSFGDGDFSAVTSSAREIAQGISWIPACLEIDIGTGPTHVHNAPYLIAGPERALMWDTGPPSNWSGVAAELDKLLGDRSLDYLVPSHPETPHCGNLHRLLAKYPEAQVVGDVRDYHLIFPSEVERFVQLPPGSEIDLGPGQRLILLSALVKDLPSSQWAYAPEQQVLFTTDAFAYSHHAPFEDEDRPLHSPDQCRLMASEIGAKPRPEQIIWITRAALYWAQFKKMDAYKEPFDELLRTYPTRMVAPAHGAVIDDMSIVSVIWEALNLAYDPEAAAPRAPA
jgi:flavorubredoxin